MTIVRPDGNRPRTHPSARPGRKPAGKPFTSKASPFTLSTLPAAEFPLVEEINARGHDLQDLLADFARRLKVTGAVAVTADGAADLGKAHKRASSLCVRSTEGLGRIFDERCDLRNPCGALLSGATRHRRIHASHDAADAAQTEDAVLPQRFKWIAERCSLALG